MKPSFEDIVAALPSLTKAQRGQLAARCSMLGKEQPEQDGSTLAPEEFLWRALVDELGKKDQLLLPSTLVSKTPEWSAFRTSCKGLDDWVKKHFDPRDQVERQRSFRIIARCIIDVVESWGVAVTPRVLLKQARNATQAVDFVYPGYAQAGLLRGWVLLAH